MCRPREGDGSGHLGSCCCGLDNFVRAAAASVPSAPVYFPSQEVAGGTWPHAAMAQVKLTGPWQDACQVPPSTFQAGKWTGVPGLLLPQLGSRLWSVSPWSWGKHFEAPRAPLRTF